MVEPVSLSILAALLVAKVGEKALDRAAASAVDASAGAGARLVEWLRSHLRTPDALTLAIEAPDSERAKGRLAEAIETDVVDPDALAELRALVEAAQRELPAVSQVAHGKGITQAVNSTVIINSPGTSHG